MNSPRTIGRYEVIDELGHGAMGSVFRAKDPAMGRVVAIKTILAAALASEQGRQYRDRFYQEAHAAGALAHPGIVPVFDVGEHEGTPFLVMEYVNGRTLENAMKKGERLTLERVCEVGQQIAEALGYAHRHGVIHRDIKPANILLTSRETYGVERAKITDFGVAKLSASEITATGQLLGTPAFMPPEQFTGAPIDGRTDLFSVGVILYQLATGEQAFPGETMTAVSYKIVHTEPVPPRKLNPAIPAQLESVILTCLAKSPAERYQTGEQLAQGLSALRTDFRATGLQATMIQASVATSRDAVLNQNPSSQSKLAPASASQASAPPSPSQPSRQDTAQGKKQGLIIAAAALLVATAVGGFMLQHRSPTASQQTPPMQAMTPSPQAVPPPTVEPAAPAIPVAATTAPATTTPVPTTTPVLATTPPPIAKKPSAAAAAKKAVVLPTATPLAAAPVPVAAPVPAPRMASVAFDPKTLDPKQNARLKLDLTRLGPSLAFTIQMNGKTYLQGTAGNKSDYESLYVPPGVHEFTVMVSGGGVQKASHIVSAEFIAKKHMTLKVELRPQPKEASQALDPATEVIATLKMDRFHF